MSSLSRSPTDRNSGNNYVRFRVFSHHNGDCLQEFAIKLKEITWDNFLRYLFGSHTFERHQPTIILLGDKHRIVLQNTNIKQLIRAGLTESRTGSYVNLLVPDFDKYFFPSMSAPGQLTSNDDEIKRKKTDVKDFAEIFSKRMDLPTMDNFVQSMPHVNFMREEREEAVHVEMPARENTAQLGELHVKLLKDGDLASLLKDGATLILPSGENKMVSVKFNNDQLPTFNETRCKYRNLNLAYECSDLKIPVLLDDDVKFLFNRDAEFVQKMAETLETAEQKQKEHIVRLKKFQETMKKLRTVNETSTEAPAPSPSTTTAPIPAPVPASLPETPATAASTQATPAAPQPDPVIPATSEGSSNEGPGAQTASLRVFRRPHRSAQKRSKRCLAAAALANGVLSSAGRFGSSVADNQCVGSYNRDRDSIVAALQDLSLVSGSQTRCPGLAASSYYPRPQVTLNPGLNTVANDAQESASDPPAWFGDMLDKFKSEVLQEVKSMVKDVIDTSVPAQSANDLKTSLESNQDDDQCHYKALDGSSPSGKHKHHGGGGGSSKKKSGCSKRGGGVVPVNTENKTVTPYTFSERILEISNSLFVYSKSGYKVRMPRNASLTIQIRVGKLSKYRSSLEDIDLRVQSVSNSIECCVKPAAPVSTAGKTAPTFTSANMDPPINYDVRIKSKDKSGKFRLYFNVIAGGRVIGHAFKIDVRVKKEYTLPFNGSEGTLNYENEVLAVPLPEPNPIPIPSTSSGSGVTFAETQKSASEISEAVAAAAAAVVELADEGIGGNQEDYLSLTSDSEYSDVSDSKPDALLKDEGIDTCYRSMVNLENQCPHPHLDSNSDTDSSISFLMDENEARGDELDDSLDVVQMPSCFIPNAELTDDVLPVRIIRKASSVTKRIETEQPQQQPENSKPSAFDSSTLTPVSTASTNVAASAIPSAPITTPAVTISDDDDDEDNADVSFLNESIKSAAVDHAYHRSLYPNLQGLKESVRPVASGTNDAAKAAPTTSGPSASESPKQQQSETGATAGASSPSSEPYPSILPDKLFEMWKNSVPIPQQMQETVSSVLSSVSNEISNAANAARAAAAAAANIVPNVPTPPAPASTAPSFRETLKKAHEYAYEAAAAAAKQAEMNYAATVARAEAAAAANSVPNVPTPPSPTAPSLLNELTERARENLKKAHEYAYEAAAAAARQAEMNYAATVARTEAAAAANSVPNVPTPPSPTAPSLLNELTERAQKYAFEAAAAAARSVPIQPTSPSAASSSIWNDIDKATNYARAAAANFIPDPSAWANKPQDSNVAAGAAAAESKPSTSQPPEEKRQKSVSFTIELEQPQPQQPQQAQQTGQSGNAAHISSMYMNLSEQTHSDLRTLHDMGFNDDPYIIYLLELFHNDLDKVIESLIHYSG
ncbi:uncharacterized protein LOC135844950 [Planococcus citri]|uniref:uncharacterized protein LOC135844950 n=1 Tax=Planococcus citri TaxID=170843 RepID=UPI0031F86ED7